MKHRYIWLLILGLLIATIGTTRAVISEKNKVKQLDSQIKSKNVEIKTLNDTTIKSLKVQTDEQKKAIEDLNKQLQSKRDKASQNALLARIVPSVQAAPITRQTGSDSLSQWLYKLRMCESGGIYNRNSGNGYYGAYQFSISTWNHWNTGYTRADLAPPEVQDATIIKNTLASQGLSTQNPGCYVKMGLSNKPPQ